MMHYVNKREISKLYKNNSMSKYILNFNKKLFKFLFNIKFIFYYLSKAIYLPN